MTSKPTANNNLTYRKQAAKKKGKNLPKLTE
jgi:hypothetical protein